MTKKVTVKNLLEAIKMNQWIRNLENEKDEHGHPSAILHNGELFIKTGKHGTSNAGHHSAEYESHDDNGKTGRRIWHNASGIEED